MARHEVLKPPFPTRGTPGGWRDWWDDPDDCAELRAQTEDAELRLKERVARLGLAWQREVDRERAPARGR